MGAGGRIQYSTGWEQEVGYNILQRGSRRYDTGGRRRKKETLVFSEVQSKYLVNINNPFNCMYSEVLYLLLYLLIVCTLPLIVCNLGTGVGESSSNINPRRESHINVNVAPPHEFGTDTPEIRFNIHSIFRVAKM